MPLSQSFSIDLSRAQALTGSTAYASAMEQLPTALGQLQSDYETAALPLLRVAEDTAALNAAQDFAAQVKDGASHIVLLGTGGSALGAKVLQAIAAPNAGPHLVVLDNLDGLSQLELTALLPLETTHVLAISKSGTTAETMAQCLALLGAYEAAGVADAGRFFAITEPGDRPLRTLGETRGWPVLDHHTRVGGRFAVLTNVGTVPGFLLGLDMAAFLGGAQAALAPALVGDLESDAAQGTALNIAAMDSGHSQTVLLGYADRFNALSFWYRQLWAESLGKAGHGTTPINGLGPVDQHSQLQLYRAGPSDKLYTVLTTDVKGTGPHVPAALAQAPALAYLAGRTIGDLVDAEQRATLDTLADAGRPVRHIHMPAITPYAMGALMMHYMLETILTAHLLSIDPFDQPAVEDGKIRAKKYLADG